MQSCFKITKSNYTSLSPDIPTAVTALKRQLFCFIIDRGGQTNPLQLVPDYWRQGYFEIGKKSMRGGSFHSLPNHFPLERSRTELAGSGARCLVSKCVSSKHVPTAQRVVGFCSASFLFASGVLAFSCTASMLSAGRDPHSQSVNVSPLSVGQLTDGWSVLTVDLLSQQCRCLLQQQQRIHAVASWGRSRSRCDGE